jgi:site-specific recombinase XerD
MLGTEEIGFVNYLVGRGLSDRTIRIYGHAVERWLVHCGQLGLDPLETDSIAMRAYSETLPDTSASRRQHAVALGHWYRWRGFEEDPTGAIRVPKRRRMRWNGVEDEQAAALVQASRGVYPEGTAVLFGLLMGLRRLEIAAVDWTRFSTELDWYEVHGKGNIVEEIPVHQIVREEINGRQSAYRYLFPGQRTAHVNPATVGLWVTQIGEAAGVPDLTPHKLRHTFISDVNDKSGDLRVAQELARHASPETTAGYTRVTRDRMIAASKNLSYAQVWPAVNQ